MLDEDLCRVVVDTNVWVAAAYRSRSASARIVEACFSGELILIITPETLGEYEYILPRAVRRPEFLNRALAALRVAHVVEDRPVPRLVHDDPSDDKFVAAADTAHGTLISSDQRVTDVVRYRTARVMTPRSFLAWFWGDF